MSLATPSCVQKLQTASHGTSCVFSESRMREICQSGSMSGCSDASWRSSGGKTRQRNYPVVSVVISGGGAGDQTVESPEVKVPVGWVETRSAPTRGASKSTGCSEGEP